MPPKIALVVYFATIAWLLKTAPRAGWSKQLWIPLIWILITLTHSIGYWLGLLIGTFRDSEGSNLDSAIFLGLIVAASRLLLRRGATVQEIAARNKWLIIYFAYIGLCVLWAENPWSSFKMWLKDVGNLPMALLLVSQDKVGAAVRAVLLRAAYIFIPLSILLFKYFPDLGRQYDIWTWTPITLGASDSKNSLGAAIILCSAGLFSYLLETGKQWRSAKLHSAANLVVIGATYWLLRRSSCATALGCTILILFLLYFLRKVRFRLLVHNFGLSLFIVVPVVLLVLHFLVGIGEIAVGALGRNMTLTGRTPIWAECLASDINPLFGWGYNSFWRSSHAHRISQHLGFYFNLMEAHNGFLETYLNCGLIGLFLLFAAIFAAASRKMRGLVTMKENALSLVIVVVALIYNVTESAFAGLNAIWFLTLLGSIEYPPAVVRRRVRKTPKREEALGPSPVPAPVSDHA